MVFLIQYPQKRSDFEYQTHFRSRKVCVKECHYLKQCRMPYMYGKYKKPLFQFVMGGHILPNISTNKLKIDGPVIISYSVHLKNSKTVIDYSLRSILIFFAYFLQRYRSWENSPITRPFFELQTLDFSWNFVWTARMDPCKKNQGLSKKMIRDSPPQKSLDTTITLV